jgi:hypothetical protein
MTMYPGYEAYPDIYCLHFVKTEVTIPSKKEIPLEMWLEIPDKPEFRGKSYQFTIAAVIEETIGGSIYQRILVTTAK